MTEESPQRTPTTLESTYPFFRTLFGVPCDWPARIERIMRTEAIERLADLFERHAVPVEEYVDNEGLVFRAELPGIDADRDVEVTVSDGFLRIRAERRPSKRSDEGSFRRQELRYGVLSRDLPLPEGVRPDEVDASYHDGILTIRVPLDRERAGLRTIPVRTA